MADNTEKKVLVTVEILDNFIKAKSNADQWKATLKAAQKEEGKISTIQKRRHKKRATFQRLFLA